MRIRLNGPSVLLLATGLLMVFTAPMAGATDAASIVPSDIAHANVKRSYSASKHLRSSVHVTASRASPGKAAQRAAITAKAGAPQLSADRRDALEIPPSVANANAQLTSTQAARNAMPLQADPTGDAADANSSAIAPYPAPEPSAQVPASAMMPSVDQLAAVSETVISGADAAASGTQLSLIGSICIGIGALLSMASAARLYIAS